MLRQERHSLEQNCGRPLWEEPQHHSRQLLREKKGLLYLEPTFLLLDLQDLP